MLDCDFALHAPFWLVIMPYLCSIGGVVILIDTPFLFLVLLGFHRFTREIPDYPYNNFYPL